MKRKGYFVMGSESNKPNLHVPLSTRANVRNGLLKPIGNERRDRSYDFEESPRGNSKNSNQIRNARNLVN